MRTQDLSVISNLVIGVTTIAFSRNNYLMKELENLGFKKVLRNENGKRFTNDELVFFLSQCDIAIVGLDKIDESILVNTRNLKAIVKYGVGLDNINFEVCKRFNIEVLHRQGVNKRSVSEMTLGFMLGLTRNLFVTNSLLKNGTWEKNGGIQLSGKTIGIIGVGHIGKDLISLLKPFKCNILVNDVIDQNEYYRSNNLLLVSKEYIYRNSDIISIHTPLDSTTEDMINLKAFSVMKSTAFVINTARSGIVNQSDLKFALKNGMISGAAIDVYNVEPPEDVELIQTENLICTPHIGGNSKEAVEEMGTAAIENVISWINGL